MFHQLWKGLGTYTLFISMGTPTPSVHTVIGLLCGPDQTFRRLHDLGHQGTWPRGNKVFLSASYVWWKLYKLFSLVFFFFFSPFKVAKSSGSMKATAGKVPRPGMCISIVLSGRSLLSRLQARAQREILGKCKLNGMERVAILFQCKRGVSRVWLQVLPGCPEIVASRLFCLRVPLLCWLEEDMLAGH